MIFRTVFALALVLAVASANRPLRGGRSKRNLYIQQSAVVFVADNDTNSVGDSTTGDKKLVNPDESKDDAAIFHVANVTKSKIPEVPEPEISVHKHERLAPKNATGPPVGEEPTKADLSVVMPQGSTQPLLPDPIRNHYLRRTLLHVAIFVAVLALLAVAIRKTWCRSTSQEKEFDFSSSRILKRRSLLFMNDM